jgi:8-hydroxy-5-deazaflavin:NADPH oxidoreductase
MRIGILGSGLMGSKLGTILARAGHEVVFSYSRSEKKLERLARDAGRGARAGTPAEAVANADAVLLAVHWSRIDDVLAQTGSLARKTVITCSLPMTKNDSRMVVGLTTSGAETLAARLRRPMWFRLSARRPARCCSRCTRSASGRRGLLLCFAATIRERRKPRRN